MHRTHGYAGQMLSKSKGWSLLGLTFGELRAQRTAFAASAGSQNQAELAEAARVANEEYDDAFFGMQASQVVAGKNRLLRVLDEVQRRQSEEQLESSLTA